MMIDVYIFGTGHLYEDNKHRIRDEVNIVGFIDNDLKKQGQMLDKKKIYSPETLCDARYDFVFLMCFYPADMREQLIEMGINEKKIFDMDNSSVLLKVKKTEVFGTLNKKNKFVVFSHSLTSTGAQNMMFNALKIVRDAGYGVIVVSREGGILKDSLIKENMSVVISEDIFGDKAILDLILEQTNQVLVNTLWLHHEVIFLLQRGFMVYWWLHESPDLKYLSKRVFRMITENSNLKLLSVSNYIDKKIKNIYGEDILLTRLLWGLEEYESSFITKNRYEDKIVFACIGGISVIKGQDIFIDAIHGLPEEIKQKIMCQIIGSGQLDERCLQITKAEGCIEMLGEIDNIKMPQIYGNIDVIVCCSRVDSMSVVVAEACMNRKLSIVSSGAGISELLTHNKDAFIFENENISELRNIIIDVVNNYSIARKMGANSRKIYERYFSMKTFEQNLMSYLEV